MPAVYLRHWDVIVRGTTHEDVVAARDEMIASRRAPNTSPVQKRIVFPPGVYDVREDALMTPGDGADDGLYGVEIVGGGGKDVTVLRFAPSATSTTDPFVGNLVSANKRLRYARVADLTIESTNPEACAFYLRHDGQGSDMNQACTFDNINIKGNWKRVWGFDGGSTANLNSEMTFRNISGATATYSDAMFKVGGISGTFNQQNQFLDYWWDNSNFILGGGTLFDVVKGGNLFVRNGSWSAASGSAPAMDFVKLGANYNNLGAAQFGFEGVRFEPKRDTHRVLDCELGHGTVSFKQCTDQSSIQNTASYDYPLMRIVGQSPWGYGLHPDILLEGCHLAGYLSYEGAAAAQDGRCGTITARNSKMYRGNNGALVVPTKDQDDGTGKPWLRWSGTAKPKYRVTDCNTALREYVS